MTAKIPAALGAIFIGGLFFAAPSEAASFDCDKASTPFEEAICDDPELSAKDETLATAYATAIGGLTEDALAEMKAGQRSWLDHAQRVCTEDAEPLTQGSYDEEGLSCLRTVFDKRIATLESSRMFKGRRIYNSDRYVTLPDPDAREIEDYYWKVATKSISSPRIDADDEVAGAFNAYVEEATEDFADLFAAAGSEGENFDNATSDSEVKLTVSEITPQRITIREDASWYGHGAAHGNYSATYRHFLIDEERPVEASDIFQGEDWQAQLQEVVFAALKDKHGDALMLDGPQDIAEMVTDPARWDFSTDTLIVQFQPYEVSAYAYGAPTAEIPFSQLEDILAPDASLIASSY